MNKSELDKFIGAVANKGCTTNQLLNINLRHGNMLKDEELLYVINGLIKAEKGTDTASIPQRTLDALKENGMLTEECYSKMSSAMKDGAISLEAVLELESSTELTMEQKQAQMEALESLDRIKNNKGTADSLAEDLKKLSTLTNAENSILSPDIKEQAKEIIDEKASMAQKQNPELMTNSIANIQMFEDMIRPLSPKFAEVSNTYEISVLTEKALMECQITPAVAAKVLTENGMNPAEISDLLKSSTTPSPEFNMDDTSAGQVTGIDRAKEFIDLTRDETTVLKYEENAGIAPATNETPTITYIRNALDSNNLTAEDVRALCESGYITAEELDRVEKFAVAEDDTPAPKAKEEQKKELGEQDLGGLLGIIDEELLARYGLEADVPVMTKKID